MKTLLVAQGLERARIHAAISIHAPNKVIVLRNNNDVNERVAKDVEEHMQLLKEELLDSKNGFKPYPFVFEVDISTHNTDFFDMTQALVDINRLLKEEDSAGNEVAIDISTGSKTISMALFLAGQLSKIKTTYCKAAHYTLDKTKHTPSGSSLTEIVSSAKEPVKVPNFPIYLADLPYEILVHLGKTKKVESISHLLRLLGRNTDKSNIISLSRKLDLMDEHGYVTISRKGKYKEIKITELGKQIAKLAGQE